MKKYGQSPKQKDFFSQEVSLQQNRQFPIYVNTSLQ